MSDNDSITSSPGHSSGMTPNTTRRLPVDFPVRTGTLNASRPLASQIAELTQEIGEITREVTQATRALRERSSHPLLLSPSAIRAEYNNMRDSYANHSFATGNLTAMDIAPAQAPRPVEEKELKRCATTLVSVLPKTPYQESSDSTQRTLAYVTVQRAVLKYQDKRPSDTLSARQARSWTQAIEPKNKMPDAKDALLLCYYMRSQGFDTYAKFERSTVSLYVVDQDGDSGGRRGEDSVYWRQNFLTNEITYLASSQPRTHTGRRNAIVAGNTSHSRLMELEEVFGEMRGSDSYAGIPESVNSYEVDNEAEAEAEAEAEDEDEDEDEAEDMDTQQDLWDMIQGSHGHGATQAANTEVQQQPLERARTQVEVRLAEAQAALDTILSTENSNPG